MNCETETRYLLMNLMEASRPYLKRKKMTPRHECKALNDTWEKCADYLEKQITVDK